MPAVPSGYMHGGGMQKPSCWSKIKLGFLMGASIGAASGILFGGYTIWATRARGREALNLLGKYIAASGGSFGVFMAVGQGIRC